MEFFEIQTRYNAMKVYVKFLAEFEEIFDKNILKLEKKDTFYKMEEAGNSKMTIDILFKEASNETQSVLF